MDESQLLEECINVNFTPLETILLSKTIAATGMLVSFLVNNNCIEIEKNTKTGEVAPAEEQTGEVLIKSALTKLVELSIKIYDNGSKIIGDEIPEQFMDIVGVYATMLEEIYKQFIFSLPTKDERTD